MDDEVRFQQLALKYLDSLYNYGRVLSSNPSEVEDLLQETLLRAFRHRDQIKPELNPKAWLLKVMKHVHIDRCRARAARPGEVALSAWDPEELASEGPEWRPPLLDPEAILIRRLAIAEVRSAIRSLPPALREVVELRDIEGLAYREIATVLDRPIGTVMSRLSRGRNLVRAALQGRPDHVTPPPPGHSRAV